ncbi:MAG TPA: hypothetical protein VM841_14275 [Actinomycetota bacterium]|nr:hypothetical protein [Actinomycetota bacterium]
MDEQVTIQDATDSATIRGTSDPAASIQARWSSGTAEAQADSTGAFAIKATGLDEGITQVTVSASSPSTEATSATASVNRIFSAGYKKRLADAAAAAKAEAELQALQGKWSYDSFTDDLSGKEYRIARIQSENTVDFDFPYAGSQHATLMIRQHPRFGLDVFLSIEKGQFLCQSWEDCTVQVRFDNGGIQRWSAVAPEDNSTTVIFLRNASRLLTRLRQSDTLRIAASFYQEGAPTFIFEVDGFQHSRFLSGE